MPAIDLSVRSLPSPRAVRRAGRIVSDLVILFLVFDAVAKLVPLAAELEALARLGYDAAVVRTVGAATLLCTVLYALPRTAVLGAVLLTGLFGGAIAAHVRVGSPLFTQQLFGLYLGLAAWGGLMMRDGRVLRMLLQRPSVDDD